MNYLDRHNHQRALESIQASLDAEIKSKAEITKQKKKLETDVNELEISLDNANKNFADLQKTNNKLRQVISEHHSQDQDHERQKAELRESAATVSRKNNNLIVELSEFRSALEQNDRSRKVVDADLQDAVDRVNELTSANTSLAAHKRKLESEVALLKTDLDDALAQNKYRAASAFRR